MHRRYEFDVTEQLRSGENQISLTFDSPTVGIKALDEQKPYYGMSDAYRGFSYIRKAHCMYGWDWGPILPDAGIWRDIYLLVQDSARITDCRILQRHEAGKVYVTASAEVTESCDVTITLTDPEGKAVELPNGVETEVTDPQLWWPNGMGSQPLYTVKAEILAHCA